MSRLGDMDAMFHVFENSIITKIIAKHVTRISNSRYVINCISPPGS